MEKEKTEQLNKILGRDIYSGKRSKAHMTTGTRVVFSCLFYTTFQKILSIFKKEFNKSSASGHELCLNLA